MDLIYEKWFEVARKKKTDVGGQKRHFKKAHRAGGTEINLHLNHTAS
jgi:hypothetical protein